MCNSYLLKLVDKEPKNILELLVIKPTHVACLYLYKDAYRLQVKNPFDIIVDIIIFT